MTNRPDPTQPYVLQTNHMVVVEVALDPVVVRAALPDHLEPAADCSGFVLFYTAGGSGDEPPSSACYAGVFLKNRDAPDGSAGIFVAHGYYSSEENFDVSKSYSLRFVPGWADIGVHGDQIVVSGGEKGSSVLELRLTWRPDRPPLTLGTHQYYGEREGGLTTYSLAFAARVFACEIEAFTPGSSAPPLLRALTAASVTRAMYVPGMPLSFSRPRAIASHEPVTSSDVSHRAILDVLSDLGRAAAIVREDGTVLFINPQGHSAIGAFLRAGRIAAKSAEEQTMLELLVADAAYGRLHSPADRMVLHKGPDDLVLVQAANYRGGWQGHPTALLLVNDPRERVDGSALGGLQLLGLTHAESRIAAAIGDGHSANEAAAALGLSQHTVRSTLKLIYSKLAISKQTELARLVEHLRWPG